MDLDMAETGVVKAVVCRCRWLEPPDAVSASAGF